MIVEHILTRLGMQAVYSGYKYRKTLLQRLFYQVLQRNKTIRISISCLLKIQKDGKYLLIRNIQRPEQFRPFGGVTKYYTSASSFLNQIAFEGDRSNNKDNNSKLERDLRGFIKAKYLFEFIDWFEKKFDREESCLVREFKEELEEINAGDILNNLRPLEFSLVRQINEIPHKVAGKSFLQFRIIKVEEFSANFLSQTDIINRLNLISIQNNDLIWVTSDEINQGVDIKGNIIGSHSCYLLGDRREIKEDRPWTGKQ
jgi:hypothetical protein